MSRSWTRIRGLLGLMLILWGAMQTASALDQFGSCLCRQCGQPACVLRVEPGKVKKSCWRVENKQVCIPSVRLPWMKCGPRCGRVRTVRVLKQHDYECDSCDYLWKIDGLCPNCRAAAH